MKKAILLTSWVVIIFTACNAQNKTDEAPKNQPQITTKVNKEYDENGNLIRYDSLYTYTFSSSNISAEEMDSILNAFSTEFNRQFPLFQKNFLDQQMFNDSIFLKEFFEPDFFLQQFFQQDSLIYQMMKELDQFKNEFYFPGNKK